MSRRLYTADFQAAAARLVTEQGYGNLEAAKSLGVPPSTMQHWVRRLRRPPAPAAPPADDPAALKAELGRLRKENERLLMEREVLKEATAFFAGERA
jgi:transposase